MCSLLAAINTSKSLVPNEVFGMKINANNWRSGKIGWVLLWLVGVPVPILLVLFLLRGCT